MSNAQARLGRLRSACRHLAATLLLAGATQPVGAAASPGREIRVVEGLKAPARITVDRWGVPHIDAKSARDAFFVQGYNAARDRLWQIDLWRKRGLGLLAKSFGSDYVEQDHAARLLLYRGSLSAEWASYSPDAKSIAEAFAAGINAYVSAVLAGQLPLPPEFSLTRTLPERWSADDIVRIRSHTLVANAASEMVRAQILCRSNIETTELTQKLEPQHVLRLPQGLDPCSIPAEALERYRLGVAPVAFSPTKQALVAEAHERTEGSNNWVVGPVRTTTGRPMLANDPHRALGVPSLRYVVHLRAPGLSAIGAGEPAMPGISFGHNGRIAWGLTIFNADQEDMYVYQLDGQGAAYRYGSGWEQLKSVSEVIEVRGGPSRKVELQFTRHGPVLHVDKKSGRAFALRSVWFEPGAAGYYASTRLLRASSWQDFFKARDNWGTPPLNLVYAHRDGSIGWSAAAAVPWRPNWDGLLPVPGDGRYEWRGRHSGSSLPSLKDPPQGWFATANEMNLPADYPAEERNLSFEWADRSRITRISEVLASKNRLSLADMTALQVDSHNVMARRLKRLLAPLSSQHARLSQGLQLLDAWDGNETVDSAAASLFQVWTSQFLPKATVTRLAPEEARPLIGAGSLNAIVSNLEKPDSRFGASPAAARDELLLSSLADAMRFLEGRLGPDMKGWSWGKLHQAFFEPAVAHLADPALKARMTVGPLPVPGSTSAPISLRYQPGEFNVISGGSVRFAIDVGRWDNSRFINTPGQSGDPASPHYRDLFPLWAAGRTVPLVYSREAVRRNATAIYDLRPR